LTILQPILTFNENKIFGDTDEEKNILYAITGKFGSYKNEFIKNDLPIIYIEPNNNANIIFNEL
jgi:hypothetical protein